MSLAQAQEAKLDHICKKLKLQPGERFWDIGSGWGGLIFWAAEHYGVKAHGIPADQGRPEGVSKLADAALERLGHCDILVNNAGATWGAPAEDHPLEAWLKLLNLNLTGRDIHVRGRGLNVELTADARVRGTIAQPQLTGFRPGNNQ